MHTHSVDCQHFLEKEIIFSTNVIFHLLFDFSDKITIDSDDGLFVY